MLCKWQLNLNFDVLKINNFRCDIDFELICNLKDFLDKIFQNYFEYHCFIIKIQFKKRKLKASTIFYILKEIVGLKI